MQIMLPSLRNTVSAQMALFKNTNTRIILYADELQKNLQSLFAAAPDINTTEVPGYKSFIDETSVPHYHARELSDDKFHDPICILHTSGSSGEYFLDRPEVELTDVQVTPNLLDKVQHSGCDALVSSTFQTMGISIALCI